MKKYLFLLLLTACQKEDTPIVVCKDEILLPLHIEIENMEGFSHIELSVTAGQMSYIRGNHILPKDFKNGVYIDTMDISDDTIQAASKVFVTYKVFNRGNRSNYTIRDTLLK